MAVLLGLRHLQTDSGSFQATLSDTGDHDTRFLFCACAISAILGDWSGVDKDKACANIRSCITYEGGIALTPGKKVFSVFVVNYNISVHLSDVIQCGAIGAEAQGGATYCAIASLCLMNRLDILNGSELNDLCRWCESRYEQLDI